MKSNEKSPGVFFCISGVENLYFSGKLMLISNVNDYLELQFKRIRISDRKYTRYLDKSLEYENFVKKSITVPYRVYINLVMLTASL